MTKSMDTARIVRLLVDRAGGAGRLAARAAEAAPASRVDTPGTQAARRRILLAALRAADTVGGA